MTDATQSDRIIIGAMSGTSADGVDVAVVRVGGRGAGMTARLVHHGALSFDEALKRKIFSARDGKPVTLRDFAEIGRDVSLAYADAVNTALLAAGLRADQVAAIAAHGQTLFHEPPLTIQWLDPALLADRTRCAVVSDFRRADCAVGGQGAPLVPFADFVLFKSSTHNRVLLNIGGVANLTFIPAGGTMDDVVAFDTGPGNCVSDFLCRHDDPYGPGYDVNGARAARGTADPELVGAVCADEYFHRTPPKSTDAPTMTDVFESALRSLGRPLPREDQFATAAAITARTIVGSFDRFVRQSAHEWVVSGGGVRNATVMGLLSRAVPKLMTADALGVPALAKEALAFALLGAATLDNEPANLPSVTGASRRVVLGAITPRP